MSKFRDLTGMKFGRLTVIKFSHKDKAHRTYWKCKCECGNQIIVLSGNLKKENTKSCGCLHREKASNTFKELGRNIGKQRSEQGKLKEIATKDCYKGTRICNLTRRVSSRNTSGFNGVSWYPKKNKWRASITFQRKHISLGYFDKKGDAIKARKEAEEKYFKPIIEEYEKGAISK